MPRADHIVAGGGAAGRSRPRLVIATRSEHKLRELGDLLQLERAELLTLDDLGVVGEAVESGSTFETNARIKARFAARATGLPSLADDSGIEVDALDGGPGVLTRRYSGPDSTDERNNVKLLEALAGLPSELRGARYVCVLALALPDERPATTSGRLPRELAMVLRRGTCRGRIATVPRGTGGFGYDPIFEPAAEPPGGRTLGEYSIEEKHAISHRARAARRMIPVLRSRGF